MVVSAPSPPIHNRSPRGHEPPWLRWLRQRIAAVRRRSARDSTIVREPIFRISRVTANHWAVVRPGAALEHAFADLDAAVAFVRHESAAGPVTVELRIDDLYVAAHLDPSRPASLFGESVSAQT